SFSFGVLRSSFFVRGSLLILSGPPALWPERRTQNDERERRTTIQEPKTISEEQERPSEEPRTTRSIVQLFLVRIAIGADHAGFMLKEHLKQTLTRLGHTVEDHGTNNEPQGGYP